MCPSGVTGLPTHLFSLLDTNNFISEGGRGAWDFLCLSHRHLFLVIFVYLDTIYILQGMQPFICKKSRSSRFSRFFNSTDASMEEWPTSSETTIIYLQNDV